MHREQFEQLCREASGLLEIPDDDAWARGDVEYLLDVETQVLLNKGPVRSLQIVMEVGFVDEEHRLEAYEAALACQAAFMGEINGMFVLDPANDRLMFTVSLLTAALPSASALAEVLKGLAGEVLTWRKTLLLGKIVPVDAEFAGEEESELAMKV